MLNFLFFPCSFFAQEFDQVQLCLLEAFDKEFRTHQSSKYSLKQFLEFFSENMQFREYYALINIATFTMGSRAFKIVLSFQFLAIHAGTSNAVYFYLGYVDLSVFQFSVLLLELTDRK